MKDTACGLIKAAVLQRLSANERLDDISLASVKMGIDAFNSGDEARCRKYLIQLYDRNATVPADRLDPEARIVFERVRRFLLKPMALSQSAPSAGQPAGEGS